MTVHCPIETLDSPKPRRADVMMLGLRSVAKGQGGVEAHVEKLVWELHKSGMAVDVIVRTRYAGKDEPSDENGPRIVSIWSPKRQSLETITHSMLGLIHAARVRPRVLHIHAVGPSLVSPLARAAGLSVVTTHHGEDYNREKWGRFAKAMLRLGEWSAARFSHARIAVSSSLARRMSDNYGVEFHYIPNGVPQSGPVATQVALEQWGLQAGSYVLNVSRIVPEKRQLDLIEAFAKLNRPDLKLVLAGAADHPSDYSREVVKRAAETPGVVMTGFVARQTLAEIYSNAGLFVLPSSHEGLPIALLEAMAYGNRVLASDIDANLNLRLPSHCYVPMGDVEALTSRMSSALDGTKPGLRADWSDMLIHYDWQDIARRTKEVYRQVAGLPCDRK